MAAPSGHELVPARGGEALGAAPEARADAPPLDHQVELAEERGLKPHPVDAEAVALAVDASELEAHEWTVVPASDTARQGSFR